MKKPDLSALIREATSADVMANTGCGFISVMSRKSPEVLCDIPAAFEMYSLLEHFMETSSLVHADLFPGEYTPATVFLEPSVAYDIAEDGTGRILALIPIDHGELARVAMWLSENLHSQHVLGLPGLLALPFTIEQHAGRLMLLPSWFAAFYVDASAQFCVPILAMKSVLAHDQFGDWVQTALHGISGFGMPTTDAMSAVATAAKTVATAAHPR